MKSTNLSMALDVVDNVSLGLGLLTPFGDDDARASNNLDSLTINVLAQTSPLTENAGVLNLDQRNVVLLAQGNDKLGVGGLVTRAGQAAQVTDTAVQSLDSLTETTGQTVMTKRGAEYLL